MTGKELLKRNGFFHKERGLFNVHSVDNWKKSLEIAEKTVDNYVDAVDSIVNMHKSG